MAKTPKVKKREISLHSRAARRGEEPPSKDLSVKSTTTVESDYKPWLHSAQNASISKKKKSKTQTHAQRTRQQKALEKAEENADRLQKKVGDSKKKSRKVQARRVDWEELNGKPEKKEVKKTKDVSEGPAKEMEGVDFDQPLAIRAVEGSAAENVPVEKEAPQTAEPKEEEDEVL